MKRTSWSAGLSVTACGVGVVAHAGSVGLRLLADRTGLTGQLSRAMVRASFVPVHDRGRVLTDVAVMLADGGEAIADIDVLRHQTGVLGPVASPPTVWRALEEVTPARVKKIQAARAWTRLLAFTGDAKILRDCEPKALRYRFLHVPARLTKGGRQRRLKIPDTWPWAAATVAVFANIATIPAPT